MARIRSIKPEVWNDPEVVACSPLARLLWIGSWNQADDYGVLKDDPGRLKLQVLPGDSVDPHALVDELVDANLLVRKVALDGTPVLVIRTFCVHQKIDRRAVGRWGKPDEFTDPPDPPDPTRRPTERDQSPPIPPTTTDSPQSPTNPDYTNGTERIGTEGTKTDVEQAAGALVLVPPPSSPTATSRSDVHVVFDAWRESTGKWKAKLDPKRKRRIEQALRDYPLTDVVDAVRGWRQSAFHRGQNDRGKPYNELDLLLRDAAHIEKFRDFERGDEQVQVQSEPKAYDAIRRSLDRYDQTGSA